MPRRRSGLRAHRWHLTAAQYSFYAQRLRALLAAGSAGTGPSGAGVLAPATELDVRLQASRMVELFTAAAVPALRATLTGGTDRADRSLKVRRMTLSHLEPPLLISYVADAALEPPRVAGVIYDPVRLLEEGERLRGDAEVGPFAVFDAGGRVLSGASLDTAPLVTRLLLPGLAEWRVAVYQRADSPALQRYRQRRRTFILLLGLGGVVALGSVLATARAVRRELRTARAQVDFVSAISHRLKTPVAGIRQLAEMLAARANTPLERRRQYYVRMAAESARLGRLIQRVLEIIRAEAGLRRYRFERLDLETWAADAAVLFSEQAELNDRRIHLDASEPLPPVSADREALTQAVHNLLENAQKYSDGPIRLTVALAGEGVAIAVQDEGIGIAAEETARVFEKFYRGAEAQQRSPGFGLGLTLVRQVVEAHGGARRGPRQSSQGHGVHDVAAPGAAIRWTTAS